jgi:hypothetical protein
MVCANADYGKAHQENECDNFFHAIGKDVVKKKSLKQTPGNDR